MVTHVGDLFGAKPHPDPGSSFAGTGRGLYFGGYDLYGPDSITHFGRDLTETLTAFLGTFTGIADDLDDGLVDFFSLTGPFSIRGIQDIERMLIHRLNFLSKLRQDLTKGKVKKMTDITF